MRRPLVLPLLLALAAACAHGGGELARSSPGEAPPVPASPSREEAGPTSPEVKEKPGAAEGAEGAAPSGPASAALAAADASRERLVVTARRHLGRRFAGDCSTFVRKVYTEARVPLPSLEPARTMSESLYQSLSPVARPRPGDLAFFDGTRRRDRAAKGRDRFTHVALVEAVDGERVTLIHRASRGIRRLAMNLERPHDRRENGMVRRHRPGDRPESRYLAAELFAGYATALDEEPQRRAPADLPPDLARLDARGERVGQPR